MTDIERDKELLKIAIEQRKAYDDFCKWCDDHDPDAWMSFDDWRNSLSIAAMNDEETSWVSDDIA